MQVARHECEPTTSRETRLSIIIECTYANQERNRQEPHMFPYPATVKRIKQYLIT